MCWNSSYLTKTQAPVGMWTWGRGDVYTPSFCSHLNPITTWGPFTDIPHPQVTGESVRRLQVFGQIIFTMVF